MKSHPKLACLCSVASAALLSIGNADAEANASLRLSDGVNTIVIADGSAGDSSAATGVVTYAGSLGGGDSTFRITAGVTKPLIGSATSPRFTLNDVTVIGGTGLLTIDFSDTDFGPISDTLLLTSIGGTTNSTVSYSLYSDPGNQLFGLTNQLTNQGPFTGSIANGGSFGGTAGGNSSGVLLAGTGFSLTQHVVIQRSGGVDDTGFTATVSAAAVPDGGSTLTLLGLAALGVAGSVGLLRLNGGPRCPSA